ncbi:MAG: hypothetical protein FWD68_07610 [Alphaproteobacteria bacterium]|nr:hypothetical protein [Alphaproteobacteria bacterium]
MFANQTLGVEHEVENPLIDGARVPRCVPWAPLTWIAAGMLVPFGIYGLIRFHAISLLTLVQILVLPSLLYVLYIIINVATVWAWLVGARIFMLSPMGFRLGARDISYQIIAYLRHDYGKHFTDVGLDDGGRIRLRWSIWAAHESWIAALSDQTLSRLQADASHRLKQGEDLIFGKELRLSQCTVTAKGRSIPICNIVFVDSLSGTNMGADYCTLRIGSNQKTTEIDMGGVLNPHVFLELLRGLIERGEGRISYPAMERTRQS